MLIVITGLMASGKSTVAEMLASQLPKTVHLRGDVFRKMIVNGREEMSEQISEEAYRQLKLRYGLSAIVARRYIEAGFTVVLQDNYYGEELPYILSLLKDLNPHLFVLDPNLETIISREQNRGKAGYNLYDIKSLYDGFHQTTARLGIWLDNSQQQPIETTQEIMIHLSL